MPHTNPMHVKAVRQLYERRQKQSELASQVSQEETPEEPENPCPVIPALYYPRIILHYLSKPLEYLEKRALVNLKIMTRRLRK